MHGGAGSAEGGGAGATDSDAGEAGVAVLVAVAEGAAEPTDGAEADAMTSAVGWRTFGARVASVAAQANGSAATPGGSASAKTTR
jgi:hypothetical protein